MSEFKKLLELARDARKMEPEINLRKIFPEVENANKFMTDYVKTKKSAVGPEGLDTLKDEIRMAGQDSNTARLLKAREDIMKKMSPDLYKPDVIFTPREQESVSNINVIQSLLEKIRNKGNVP